MEEVSIADCIDTSNLMIEFDQLNEIPPEHVAPNIMKDETMTENNNIEETLLAKTPIFDVVKGPAVKEGFNPVQVKSKDWVCIIVEKNGKLLMEQQLRHGLGKVFEEFPCGMAEDGEHPIVAALRELEEETGIVPKNYDIKCLGKFAANPAFMTNYMHYFYIKLDTFQQGETSFDENEDIKSYWKDKKDAFEDFAESEGSAILGCAWMLLMKNGILSEW